MTPDLKRAERWRQVGLGLLLVAGTFLIYQPVWRAGFIWDDDSHLTNNACVVGPLGFKAIWTSAEGLYYPLVLSSFWVQHALWGLNPLPYHLVNVGMHAACAVLLWQALRRFGVYGAWLGAALWAWHPVQAESVAWITELKNTQSGLFYLLAVLCFERWWRLKAHGRERDLRMRKEIEAARRGHRALPQKAWAAYVGTLVCATLAILSKSSTVMLPVILGLCWWWKEKEWRWRNVLWLVPLVMISAGASAWTIWEQRFHSNAIGVEWQQAWSERFVIAGKVIWFYLGKLVWPHPLSFIYPRWDIQAPQPTAYFPLIAAAAVMLLFWRFRREWGRGPFFAFGYFVISLFPVLGFFTIYFFRYSFVGDHFQYLASMGPLALAGAGLAKGSALVCAKGDTAEAGPNAAIRTALVALPLLLLGFLTWRQAAVFTDNERLWRTTLERNPDCAIARNNLGEILFQRGDVGHAKEQYELGLKSAPNYPELQNNLGNALFSESKLDEAIAHYRKAAQSQVSFAEPHYNLGKALFEKGQTEEAITEYEKAIEAAPLHPEAHYNLGCALLQRQRIAEAIAHFETSLKSKPSNSAAHNNLATALSQQGRVDEAIVHYRLALESDAANTPARLNLANMLLARGQPGEAVSEYQRVLAVMPADAVARKNMGTALLQTGKADEAIQEYRRALELAPDDPGTLNNLGSAYMQKGSFAQAVDSFQKSLVVQPGSTRTRINLGLALLQAGKKDEAKAQFAEAVRLEPGLVLPAQVQELLR